MLSGIVSLTHTLLVTVVGDFLLASWLPSGFEHRPFGKPSYRWIEAAAWSNMRQSTSKTQPFQTLAS